MRPLVTAATLLVAMTALAACSTRSAGSALPAPPSAAGGVAALIAGSMPLRSSPVNVRRGCPYLNEPGMMYCDVLIPTGSANPNISGYAPADLQAAYNLPSSTHGNGQTIAIVDAFGYPTAESDLAIYRSKFGLPACTTANGCFRKVNETGGTHHYPPPDQGWDVEQALDVDMVSATCPNCHILLVESKNNTGYHLALAVDEAVRLGANVVSNSYGGPCRVPAPKCGSKRYNHPGVIILASAGDNGYWGKGVTIAPAGFGSVISVGGTHLVKTGSGRGWTETVWSGTGSGCTHFAKPAWQTDSGCPHRASNDVAAVADPSTGVQIAYNGHFTIEGGTSVSSPLIAGVYGLAGNSNTLDAAQSLYQNTSDLYDITNGSDGTCTPAYICTGEVGYDGPTGNGTPNGIGAF